MICSGQRIKLGCHAGPEGEAKKSVYFKDGSSRAVFMLCWPTWVLRRGSLSQMQSCVFLLSGVWESSRQLRTVARAPPNQLRAAALP